MQSQEYDIVIHPQTYMRHNQSAGTSADKLNAFYELWENPQIDIIWAAGGGNRCLHWIDDIDYTRLKSEKPVIGFSDVTALINAIYAHKGYKTFHGPTFNKLYKNPQKDHLLKILSDENQSYECSQAKILNEGTASGHLIGGNLSIFQYIPQTLASAF